jgi:hypothetical protein
LIVGDVSASSSAVLCECAGEEEEEGGRFSALLFFFVVLVSFAPSFLHS